MTRPAEQAARRPVDLRLYGIIDPARSPGEDLGAAVGAAMRGGVTLLQLRDKQGPARERLARASMVREALRGRGIQLIVNDRVDIALAVAADGVHLGADDMPPREARRLMGADAIIGITVHDEAEAAAADVDIADYAGIGPVFKTGSKADALPPHGLDGFARLVRALKARAPDLPVAGIAGITGANAAGVIAAGADGVAVIGAIFNAADLEAAAAELRAKVDRALAERGL